MTHRPSAFTPEEPVSYSPGADPSVGHSHPTGSVTTYSGHAPQDAPGGHTGHGGHRLMMLVCCIPMIVATVVLVATGVAGGGAIVGALVCMVMMAAMMFMMPGGHQHK